MVALVFQSGAIKPLQKKRAPQEDVIKRAPVKPPKTMGNHDGNLAFMFVSCINWRSSLIWWFRLFFSGRSSPILYVFNWVFYAQIESGLLTTSSKCEYIFQERQQNFTLEKLALGKLWHVCLKNNYLTIKIVSDRFPALKYTIRDCIVSYRALNRWNNVWYSHN